MSWRPEKVIVLGGGICGLATAHGLAADGHDVVVVESSDQLGGLGTYFDWNGRMLDKFYHCIMPSDDDLLRLIRDVGIEDKLYWEATRMGFVVGGKRYAFNGALDLLGFTPLNFFDRIRFGIVSLLLRKLGEGKDLDNMRIEDWLTGIYGERIWTGLMKPLFVSKFGPAAGNMPALYIWERLGREKNKASRGYLEGGLHAMIGAVESKLKSMNVEFCMNATVKSVDEFDESVQVTLSDGETIESDWCVSTMPLPVLKRAVAGSSFEDQITIPDLKYQGVVNGMFFLKRPLDNYYWAPVMDSGTEFDGIVEMTELVRTEHYGGHHVAYVMKYCDRDCDLFKEPEEQIAARWKDQLLSLYPDFLKESDIADVCIFKAPFVEPAYPLNYSALKPAITDGKSRLFLATSAQVYPRITSWNSSVGLANEVARQVSARIEEELPAIAYA